jgi:hypothetical protein
MAFRQFVAMGNQAVQRPDIHCTPPTDTMFVAAARRAFEEARTMLDGSVAVYVGTLLRVRSTYPQAAIVWASVASDEGTIRPVWLISREGWTSIELDN